MLIKLRIIVNCLISAILSVVALWAMMSLGFYMDTNSMSVLGAITEVFDRENIRPVAFIYDILRFIVFGSIVAGLMVLLKPRRILLYSIASILALASLLHFFLLSYDFFSVALPIIWTLTIPLFYVLFVRLAEKKHNKSLNTDTGDAGAG